ncbi:glycine cleavage system aminomethyltransferase GcvT [Atopobacter sp. AH10]|uniref:glycine cleavage system aminomethyltransferase GcvT n=1 Tax=Atopobacter sp. AH10 TaxID=2315861 RepID=UPI001F02BD96|nr:glycine cleavage system aminomethyltransferase GcvT [Atopobacter sp. AH10]
MIVKNELGLRQTPLYDYFVKEKQMNLADFNGWALPTQFTKIKDEHQAVRESVGLFDASHMGELRVKGEKALDFINGLVTNECADLEINHARYTAMTKEDGGVLDDLIIFKLADDELMITPNAGNYEKIFTWLKDHNDGSVVITNESAEWGLVAVQGPKAVQVLAKITDCDLDSISHYCFRPHQKVAEFLNVVVSRTGYTGEDGFELYCPWDHATEIWKALLKAGEEFSIAECGLGARDTLRLEAGMPLYGNDFDESVNPIEGGIAFAVKTGKKKPTDYIGKKALEDYKALPDEERYMSRGFTLKGKGIARHGFEVKTEDGQVIGLVTSGTKAPTVGEAIGYVRVKKPFAKVGERVYIDIRGKLVPAELNKKDWLAHR